MGTVIFSLQIRRVGLGTVEELSDIIRAETAQRGPGPGPRAAHTLRWAPRLCALSKPVALGAVFSLSRIPGFLASCLLGGFRDDAVYISDPDDIASWVRRPVTVVAS